MADSTLSALPKGIGAGILPPSTHSSQSMTPPLLRNAYAYRNNPHRPNPTDQTRRSVIPRPSSTAKSRTTASYGIARK